MGWELPERFESVRGTVRWASFGQGDPVVLMHGTPFSSYVWRDIAAALSSRYQVFVWDMPGYGQSEMHDGQDVSLAAQQEVFAELLQHWGLVEPAVIAHDFGGAVALRTALLSGARYGRLALVDAVSVRPWGSEFFRLAHDNSEAFTALPPLLHEALVRRYITTAAHRELRDDVLDHLVAPWLGPVGQAAFYRQIGQADERYTREVEDRYAELDCPVLIAWGDQDQWLPPARAKELAARIPHAEVAWIGECGHLVQEDNPAQLTALITGFLAAGELSSAR
ncbi:Pimeloyl-ACP methyl ester carboxylesterase [Saccharopolyspora antimicrobica]|uniref:Pimeloyl-ACP methyl ester carboxylesterase n=1 Tax=Saccharopolyspora antimicrobica TaxID=455193 RepID=A0A1I4W4V9_9PSEU|nr:alpha/beta hydrolase [Saccharopolyspora antimicrobica]RKT87061.1 pimeloyl-ACP methyl ester carboxylesterase [Saccharopolyspora antimicrobica]SFN08523.1 Pimeloyl-ACP methyl ester carboxylesterase [Saccharopolyspora antimicrobica]